jgi:tRNA A-37 threonylcarbamoyl transferase component Bud32
LAWNRWRKFRHLLWFAAAFFLFDVGILSQILGIPPDVGSNAVSSCIFYTAAVLSFTSACSKRFGLQPKYLLNISMGALIVAAIWYFFYVDRNLTVRVYVLNFSFGALFLITALQIRHLVRKPIEHIFFWVLCAFGIQSFLRTVLSVRNLGNHRDPLTYATSPFWIWLNLSFIIFAVLFGVTLLTMTIFDILEDLKHPILAESDNAKLPELGEWRVDALSPYFENLEGVLLDDRFEVLGVLARGGFATVFHGRDLQRQSQPCAIKIFRPELLDEGWMDKRFQHEVAALTQIHHPNVVGIYGHGITRGGAPYLAMEFVDGKMLRELLNEGPLAYGQVGSYLRQAANALAEIHKHGIWHRDVKPENLMIRNTAAPGQELVLIDFSIAIVQDLGKTIQGLSRAVGTPYYMAPEQAIGYADASSDIYSLAKILIEMLTGRRLSELLPKASIDLPDRVRELLAKLRLDLSGDSIQLIAIALEFDPSHRPKGAIEFAGRIAEDLDAAVHRGVRD